MFRKLTASHYSGNSTHDVEYESPTNCPHCMGTYSGEICFASVYTQSSISYITDLDITKDSVLSVIHHCPLCHKSFFGSYFVDPLSPSCSRFLCSAVFPEHPDADFPKNICALSPRFVSVYRQAHASKQNRLFDLCGPGYRKSLEILIKDFAIYIEPDNSSIIPETPLQKCINEYIDSPQLRSLATAAAFIGNDETHYEKRYTDADFTNMETYIKAVAMFISAALVAVEAKSFVQTHSNKQ